MVVMSNAENQDKETFVSFPSGTALSESLKCTYTPDFWC